MDVTYYVYSNARASQREQGFHLDCCNSSSSVWVLTDGGEGNYAAKAAFFSAQNVFDALCEHQSDCSVSTIENILTETNTALINEQKANLNALNMRTSIAGATLCGNVFRYFHVGDVRLYYFKNGCLYARTKDHSVSQKNVEEGKADDVRFDCNRTTLLKSLGASDALEIKDDICEIEVENGDAFLLCSDGFWEYVYETEMELDLIKSLTPKQWCDFMLKRFLPRLSRKNDDYTAVCGTIVWEEDK